MNAIARAPGSFAYPTRNFARILLKVSQEAGLYLDLPFWPDDPGRKVSEGSLLIQGLPCGLSPCPPDFYCPLGADEYRTAVRGVSRIWSSFTKASDS